jgi:hypothetical protein
MVASGHTIALKNLVEIDITGAMYLRLGFFLVAQRWRVDGPKRKDFRTAGT